MRDLAPYSPNNEPRIKLWWRRMTRRWSRKNRSKSTANSAT